MADVSFWQSIDGRWKQLKRWTMHIVDGTPLGAVAGAFWYDRTEKRPKWHDGTTARNFGGYVSSGVSSSPGPEWTAAGGASVTMAACKCRLYDNANFLGEPKEYDIPAKTLTLTDGADQMCVVHYNAGSPEYAIVDAWDTAAYNLSNVVTVYRFWYAFGDVHSASVDSLGLGLTEKQALRLGQTDYYKRIGGVGLEPSLSGLTLSVSSAGVWAGPVQMAIAAFASGTDSMEYIYKTSAGAWISVDVTAIPNTLYNPSAGLATLSNSSKWTALYIYRTIGDSKECYVVLDTAEYNSETSAMESAPRADVPRIIQSHCVLVGRVLIQKNATTGTVESAWRTAFGTGGGVTTHNDLSGLQGGETGYYGHLTAAQVAQAPRLLLGTCATPQATTAKEVTLPGYTLNAGDVIVVRFTYGSAATSKLNVNGTGAKTIYEKGLPTYTASWSEGNIVGFMYDGAYWHILWVKFSSATGYVIDKTMARYALVIDSTNNENYPLVWESGGQSLYKTAAKLYFNPSTGHLQATKVGVIGGADTGFLKADGTVDSTTYAPLSSVPAVDSVPTDGSSNAVSSNGVFDALATKANEPTLYTNRLPGDSNARVRICEWKIEKGGYYGGSLTVRIWQYDTWYSYGYCDVLFRWSITGYEASLSYSFEYAGGSTSMIPDIGLRQTNDATYRYFMISCNSTNPRIQSQLLSNVVSAGSNPITVGHRNVADTGGPPPVALAPTPPASDDSQAIANTKWVNSRAVPTIITANATLPAGAPIGKSVFADNSQSTSSITISAPSGESIYYNGYPGSVNVSPYIGVWFVKTSSTRWVRAQ